MAGDKEYKKKKVEAGDCNGSGSTGNACGSRIFFLQPFDTFQSNELFKINGGSMNYGKILGGNIDICCGCSSGADVCQSGVYSSEGDSDDNG